MNMVTKFEKPGMDTFRENGLHKNYMCKVTELRSKPMLRSSITTFLDDPKLEKAAMYMLCTL